jgi:hypothetical protein
MKMVKIVSGVKRIDDSDANSTLFRLRDILSEHRSVLITRLVSDLRAYIDYKFNVKASAKQLDMVKEHLYVLKNSSLDINRYSDIVDHFFQHDMTYIRTEPFLREIDDTIGTLLTTSQLKIVD